MPPSPSFRNVLLVESLGGFGGPPGLWAGRRLFPGSERRAAGIERVLDGISILRLVIMISVMVMKVFIVMFMLADRCKNLLSWLRPASSVSDWQSVDSPPVSLACV